MALSHFENIFNKNISVADVNKKTFFSDRLLRDMTFFI